MIQQNVSTLNKHNSYCSDLDCFFLEVDVFKKPLFVETETC